MRTGFADDEWWTNVFSEEEIRDLNNVWNEILAETETEDNLSPSIEISLADTANILNMLWKSFLAENEPYATFLFNVGQSIARQYLTDSSIEYDEAITDAAMFFIQLEDIWENDDEDDEEDEDDEDEDLPYLDED
jgi:hypothetical protein